MDDKVELERRIERLEQRIAQLEQRYGNRPLAATEPELADPSSALTHMPWSAPPLEPRPLLRPEAPPLQAVQLQPSRETYSRDREPSDIPSPPDSNYLSELVERRRASYVPRESAPAVRPPAIPPPVTALPPLPATRTIPPPLAYQPRILAAPLLEERPLEQTIGLKWAGWIGAMVVVIGAALGVKYAYDAGWIGKVPPELRLLLMTIGGFTLIATGEWVYRKVNHVSAAGLFGAGVATLFLVSYSGHGFLDVYGRSVAFLLMALTTLIGSGVAVRGRLVSIAVLSLLGGNVAPLILGGEVESLMPLLSYLVMLQTVALVLAWWGGTARWWTLRWLVLVSTSLWMTMVLASPRFATDQLTFVFVLIYWGLFLGELILSALRPRLPPQSLDLGAGVVFSLAVTAGLVIATLVALQDAGRLARGAWIVAYALLYATCGLALARSAAGRPLAVALRTLAAALVLISVPVALAGSAVVLVWAAMALAFGAVGARLNLVISRVASVVTWIAGVVYLVVALNSPALSPSPSDVLFTVVGVHVPVYVGLAWLLALAGLGVAWLLATSRAQDRSETEAVSAIPVETPGWSLAIGTAELLPAARTLSATAGAEFIIASMLGLPADAATVVIVLWVWLLVALDYRAGALFPAAQAMAVLIFVAVKWATVDILVRRVGEGWTSAQLAYTPVLNRMTAMGALIAVSLAGAYWLRRRSINEMLGSAAQPHIRTPSLWLAGTVITLITLGLSLEIDRIIQSARPGWSPVLGPMQVQLLSWTMLWCFSTMAFAGIAWRLVTDLLERRRLFSGLGILPMLLAVKFVTFDTILWHVGARRVFGPVVLNLEFVTALVVLAAVGVHLLPLRARLGAQQAGPSPAPGRSLMSIALGFTALIVLLLLGQWEIGRALNLLAISPLARGVAISIWWSIFAIAAVVAGFAIRKAGLRYFGLALFAITLLKVLIFDTQTLDRGWRTISFIALGLLLLGTSVVYGKYSGRLLREKESSAGQ